MAPDDNDFYEPPFPLLTGMGLRCPRCGIGKLYRSYFKLHECCPTCRVRYQREDGAFTGAIYLNLILTELGFGVLFLIMEIGYGLPVWQELTIGIAWSLVFPLIFFRHANGIFVGIIQSSQGLTPDLPEGDAVA